MEESDRRAPVRLFYPEYGPVEALVGFAIFYLILERLTPTLVDALAGPFPEFAPDPLTTGTAMLLWLLLGLTVGGVVRTVFENNPREFEVEAERDSFLAAHRPSARDYGFNLALLVLGGAAAGVLWSRAIEALREMARVLVELDGVVPPGWSFQSGAVLVVFFVGFAAFARGVDRLVVGGMREVLYWFYAADRA